MKPVFAAAKTSPRRVIYAEGEDERVLKPLLTRLHREFNVSTAEVGFNDAWQTAEVALVTVANNDPGHVQASLERVVVWVQTHRPEVQVVDWHIETF